MKAIMKNLGYTVILLVIFGFNYVDNKQTVATESHSYISISYQLTDDRLLRAPRKIIICYSTQKVDVIEVTKTESIEDRIVSVLNAMSAEGYSVITSTTMRRNEYGKILYILKK